MLKWRCYAWLSGVQQRLASMLNNYMRNFGKELFVEYESILQQEEAFWFQRARS